MKNKEDEANKKLIYNIMLVKYVKAMGREVSENPETNRDLYPSDWFGNKDYVKKANILAEAIKNKCLIIETKGYLDIIERNRFEKQEKS